MESNFEDTGVKVKSNNLEGIKIAFGLCGSIGAVDSVKQIRELRRHGAIVRAVMTEQAQKFITPLSIQWATTQKPILNLSGESEHLQSFSAMIICPATWNTLIQISQGLSGNALSTLAAIHVARKKPLFIVPTLHLEFLDHPMYSHTMDRLQSFPGIEVYWGPKEEGRYKMPNPEIMATDFMKFFSAKG